MLLVLVKRVRKEVGEGEGEEGGERRKEGEANW